LRQNSWIGFEELFNSRQRRPLNSGTLLLDGSIPVCPEDPKPTVRKYGLIRAPVLSNSVIMPGTGAAQMLPISVTLTWSM